MKTANTIFKLFLTSIMLMACSTESPAELDASLHIIDVETPAESAGTFTAMVDGQEFTIDIATAKLDSYIDLQGNTVSTILISGKKGAETITLRMPADIDENLVTNPYVLGRADTAYTAFYNTDVSTISESTTLSDLHMTIDGSANYWMADAPTVTITGGVTTIKGLKSATVDTGLIDNDGTPIYASVNQTVNMTVQGDQTGSFSFGSINLANYSAGGAGGDVFEADITADNGAVTLEVDDVNKLISGTFNFEGTETYTSTYLVPSGVDTDGDGIFDGVETSLGYDPNNICSPIRAAGYTGYDVANADWLAADCDFDTISNQDELNGPDGDPTTIGDNTDPYGANGVDTDGDGVSDAQETLDGDDVNDPCSPSQLEQYTGYDAANTIWSGADCDGDTVNNGDEVTNGTDPYFVDFLKKTITAGIFSKVPYAEPVLKRGLNISTHDVAGKRIAGTYSFVSASLGEDPTRWYVITGGTFDVIYTE